VSDHLRGPSDAPVPTVRSADLSEFAHLRTVEEASDRILAESGIGPFAEDGPADHLSVALAVFVAGDPAVGVVSLVPVDGHAHVEQLSVLPDHGRRGIGRALMETAIEWAADSGYTELTLTTYRDVPFNGPFYRTLGFEQVADPGPELAAIRAHERDAGNDDFGPRIAMRKVLRPPG